MRSSLLKLISAHVKGKEDGGGVGDSWIGVEGFYELKRCCRLICAV